MKNTEYITMPSPDLVEEYVMRSQISLIEQIKKEIDDIWDIEYVGNCKYIRNIAVMEILDRHLTTLKGEV